MFKSTAAVLFFLLGALLIAAVMGEDAPPAIPAVPGVDVVGGIVDTVIGLVPGIKVSELLIN